MSPPTLKRNPNIKQFCITNSCVWSVPPPSFGASLTECVWHYISERDISTHDHCIVCQCMRSWSSHRCSSPTAGYKYPCWHRSPPDRWCWDLRKSSHPHAHIQSPQTNAHIEHTHTHTIITRHTLQTQYMTKSNPEDLVPPPSLTDFTWEFFKSLNAQM